MYKTDGIVLTETRVRFGSLRPASPKRTGNCIPTRLSETFQLGARDSAPKSIVMRSAF